MTMLIDKKNKVSLKSAILLPIAFLVCVSVSVFSSEVGESPNPPHIGLPEYNVTDSNNINVVSGNLSYNFQDLSIGSGRHALTHSIHVSSNDLANLRASKVGYKDKYDGGITVRFDEIPNDDLCASGSGRMFEYLYVYDHESSYRFMLENGAFKSISDVKIKLDVHDAHTYVVTKADGTKVYFYSRTAIPNVLPAGFIPEAVMTRIVAADGFEITIHRKINPTGSLGHIKSVTSNNGFQLKYIYDSVKRPLPANKVLPPELVDIQNAYSNEWFNNFPNKIIALNNAVEICPLLADNCTLQKTWPQATYSWPGGMPAALFIGASEFVITDYRGIKTTFHHLAIDQFRNCTPGGTTLCTKNKWFYPHIVKVENNAGMKIEYSYDSVPPSYNPYKTITKACNHGVCSGYGIGARMQRAELGTCRTLQYTYGSTTAYKGVVSFRNSWEKFGENRLSVPFYIETWDKRIYLAKSFANEVNKIESKLTGGVSNYEYDSFGRLKTKEENGAYQKISYPYSYNGICHNFRFCHKPSSVTVFQEYGASSGYSTVYHYHPESGNVQEMWLPRNKNNKDSKTIYKYQQYSARYLNSNNTMASSNKPIWLLASEFHCQNSDVSADSCAGNDKVTTTYHYGSGTGSDNLFLQGKTITSEADNENRTFCYKYDQYGNQIEQSQPKSGITNCNSGREF
jgi:hypothetical protein